MSKLEKDIAKVLNQLIKDVLRETNRLKMTHFTNMQKKVLNYVHNNPK